MKKRPLILVSASVEKTGVEFADRSLSISERYLEALLAAGAVPLTMPAGVSREAIATSIQACDGVMLTGGDDIEPKLYGNGLPAKVLKTVETSPDGGERDLREVLAIDEVFRQRKPLLAICRGHQMVNVALGGTLVADIRSQKPRAMAHQRMDRRNDVTHEVQLTDGSLLSKITGRQTLGVNSTHHQAVGKLAEPLRAVARSADGIIEGTELKQGAALLLPFLLTVQFHPERLADRYPEHRAIFRAFTLACSRTRL